MWRAGVVVWMVGCESPRHPTPPSPEPCIRNFDPEADELVIAGMLAGRPIRVGIDTGSNLASVSATVAKTLPKIAGARSRTNSAFDTPIITEVSSIAGLELGGHHFATFRASINENDGPDITIGVPQLEGLRLVLDLQLGKACISAGGGDALADGQAFERVTFGLLTIPVTSRNREVGNWLLDTGAGMTVVGPDRVAEVAHKETADLEASDATGTTSTQPTIEIAQLCTLGICKAAQSAMVLDLTGVLPAASDGVIGLSFLRGSRLVIDFSLNRISLQ